MLKINEFKEHLIKCEKSESTIEKYLRDIKAFSLWLGEEEMTKETILEYKKHLQENYKVRSVNSILSSLNAFFEFLERHDLKVKTIKMQRKIFLERDKELTKAEYERLLDSAKKQKERKTVFCYADYLCNRYSCI